MPGKFEAAPPYAADLWTMGLEGFADVVETADGEEAFGFRITAEDVARDPRLAEHLGRTLMLVEDEQGFVTVMSVEATRDPSIGAQALAAIVTVLAVIAVGHGAALFVEAIGAWAGAT